MGWTRMTEPKYTYTHNTRKRSHWKNTDGVTTSVVGGCGEEGCGRAGRRSELIDSSTRIGKTGGKVVLRTELPKKKNNNHFNSFNYLKFNIFY